MSDRNGSLPATVIVAVAVAPAATPRRRTRLPAVGFIGGIGFWRKRFAGDRRRFGIFARFGGGWIVSAPRVAAAVSVAVARTAAGVMAMIVLVAFVCS
jgi:hypothetical protein